jgi:hypothetical protein
MKSHRNTLEPQEQGNLICCLKMLLQPSSNSAITISLRRRGVNMPCAMEEDQPSSASQLASKASERLRLSICG